MQRLLLHTKVHYDWGPSGEYAPPFVSWYVGEGERAAFQLGPWRDLGHQSPLKEDTSSLSIHPVGWGADKDIVRDMAGEYGRDS